MSAWRKPHTCPQKGKFIAAFRWSARDRLRIGVGEWFTGDQFPGVLVDGAYVPCVGWLPLPDVETEHAEHLPLHLRSAA